MKRSPIKIALVVLGYLAAGAVVNVVMAWWIAMRCDAPFEWEGNRVSNPPRLVALAPPIWTRRCTSTLASNSVVERIVVQFGVYRDEQERTITEYRIGWPVRTMQFRIVGYERLLRFPHPRHEVELRGGISLRKPYRANEVSSPLAVGVLPLQPVWPGFILAAILTSGVLFLLFHVPKWTRAVIRGKRAQCPACAYPIGVSDCCTECGRELPGWVLKLRGDGPSRAAMSEHKPEG